MPNSTLTALVGRGIKFPMESTDNRGVNSSELIERINQSLLILLDTPKGSRLMVPEFGSDIYKYRFDPFDNILIDKLKYALTQDILKWEPRIRVSSIKFYDDDQAKDNHMLYIAISYKIINTDVEGNFVYPYRSESYETARDDF